MYKVFINKKGFTLIELLAVIVVLAILLLVGIPAVSRMIENARRKTFAHNIYQYLTAVKHAYSTDDIHCWVKPLGSVDYTYMSIASAPFPADGAAANSSVMYYVPITTSDSNTAPSNWSRQTGCSGTNNKLSYDSVVPGSGGYIIHNVARANAYELFETGGKSPFGNADIYGYIIIRKKKNRDVSYEIRIADSLGNGHQNKVSEDDVLASSKIVVGGARTLFGECEVNYCMVG